MADKTLPFDRGFIEDIIERYPTPFHLYLEQPIQENFRNLLKTFSWNDGFKEFFAVKALPNPFILRILGQEGAGTDCSSAPELTLSEKVGIVGENIMFSSNDTPAEEYRRAAQLGAIINVDEFTHLPFLENCLEGYGGLPDLICFRYNPGPAREKGGSIAQFGKPEGQKYGMTRKQCFEAYKIMRDKGVRRFGVHTMIASNELNPQYFVDTANMLFDLVAEFSKELGMNFEFINIGGGIGIPYRPEQEPVDLEFVSAGIKKGYEAKIIANGLHPLKLFMENGRMITGPYGFLVATVRHVKDTYKRFVGLDACMADHMRPGMYGPDCYHHLTVLGKEDWPLNQVCDVTGSLCENNDKFAVDRPMPRIDVGDIVVIHDTGAHGRAMCFNYNGKLRPGELLARPDGGILQIRRPETENDYFATLDFEKLERFS